MKKLIILPAIIISIAACNTRKDNFDASGTFEANEIIVSAQQSGQLLSLKIHEGERLTASQQVGKIDVTNLQLQQAQTEAQVSSLQDKLNTSAPQTELVRKQISVQQAQLDYLMKEQQRTENLLKADAATQKQSDDINVKVLEAKRQLAVLQQQIALNKSNVSTQNSSVLSQKAPLEKTISQIKNEINKGIIINPVKGTVLSQYAYEGEMTSTGKALYKIANLDTIILRAYITGAQLPTINLNKAVTVKTDDGKGNYKNYKGTINWVSDKAEFTPKTIQTKDERQNMVYAIKIQVPNDGYLKIGMYGEVVFN
ncbi:MAG: HlyD family efflux transporter periplasmic adaptor subunit [Ginsengibacter sp.]